ncbi:NUDIX hydrolase [Luteimicrobium sp. NPDC057192]|uniref:NUDIX hydrolase n=1 Tax=Luteimicrobium sp. NPDC057192 TaxID=3346042 RepID=UPI0036314C21
MTAPATAHAQLAAVTEGDHAWATSWRYAIGTMDPARTRDAAVLVLFGVLDAIPATHRTDAVARDLDVLLLARAATLGQHAGQVAFPGGRVDPRDDGPVAAALREAVEETGLDATGVEVLGTFPPLPVPVSNHLVTPVLGWWATPTPVRVVDVAESAHVFRVPVADLVDPENRRTVVARRGTRAYRGPGFLARADGREHLVWGFTAGILDALLDRLGWAEPWDTGRTLDLPL